MPERSAEVTAEVLGRGSIYTLGTAAPVLAQLAVTPFVARLLTETTGYGQVAVALVVLQVTMILASLGLPSVITRQALLASGGIPGARSLFRRGAALTAVVIAAAVAATPGATWAVPTPRIAEGETRAVKPRAVQPPLEQQVATPLGSTPHQLAMSVEAATGAWKAFVRDYSLPQE